MMWTRAAVPVLALAVLSACGERSEAKQADALDDGAVAVETAAPAAPAAEMPSGDAAAPPTDAQIAAIVLTANSVDSTAGVLAASKATDPRVKEFGQRMAADHGAVNKQAVALAQKIGLTPEPNPTSQSLKEGGEQNMQKLQGLSGAAFDKAYLDHEVALHEQVINALDKTFIPSAQNPELKALLEKGRPIFVGHLDMAKQLQASLGGGS